MSKVDKPVQRTNIFVPGLTLLFIGLKLTGHITWSWLWVLSPFWIGAAVAVAVVVVMLLVAAFVDWLRH